jgi:hypothetical protein
MFHIVSKIMNIPLPKHYEKKTKNISNLSNNNNNLITKEQISLILQ